MSATWRTLDTPLEPAAAPLMDALLTPHRSLGGRTFLIVMASFTAVNLVVAIVFWLRGAYPVSGFLGLDVVALAWAFRVNYRAARARERVIISREAVQIMQAPAGKAQTYCAASPLWVRVEEGRWGVQLRAGARSVSIGSFLSPAERRSFAAALRGALERARR